MSVKGGTKPLCHGDKGLKQFKIENKLEFINFNINNSRFSKQRMFAALLAAATSCLATTEQTRTKCQSTVWGESCMFCTESLDVQTAGKSRSKWF